MNWQKSNEFDRQAIEKGAPWEAFHVVILARLLVTVCELNHMLTY